MAKRRSRAATVLRIERSIVRVRDERVMLDEDLAQLYGVSTKALNQAVRRNRKRFPDDFMLELTLEEWEALRSHSVTSNAGRRGGRRALPFAFSEHGVAMLSSVLRSSRAVAVNIEIIRTFVRMRKMLLSQEALARRLDALERRIDDRFRDVFHEIRELIERPRALPTIPVLQRQIGFRSGES